MSKTYKIHVHALEDCFLTSYGTSKNNLLIAHSADSCKELNELRNYFCGTIVTNVFAKKEAFFT